MYRIVIVDDNQKICDDIHSIIKQYFPQFTVSGIYNNGLDAIASFKTLVPDILICDIKMPGAGGVEVCKQLRTVSKQTQIILITAYKDFDSLKEAINCNVSKFLLKPYSNSELTDALNEVVLKIDESLFYANATTALYFETRKNFTLKLEKILNGDENAPDISDDLVLCGTTAVDDTYIYEINCSLPKAELPLDFDSNFLSCIQIKNSTDDLPAIAFSKERIYLENYLNDCLKEAKYSNKQVKFNVSERKNLTEWKAHCGLRARARAFVDSLFSLDFSKNEKLIENIEAELNQKDFDNFLRFCKKQISQMTDLNIPESLVSLEELSKLVYNLVNESQRSFSSKIADYIENNFSDTSLSVTSIAYALNMNSNYIGNKFRKETGKSISSYINEVRIGKAKQYIAYSPLSMNEIASKVGFQSTRYFYAVFKAVTGTSPSKFQKNERNKST